MAITVQVGAGPGTEERPDFAGMLPGLRRLLASAVRTVLRREGVRDAEFSITLLDDAGIADLNSRFLSHPAITDVIAFALYEPPESPVGDVYIGYDQASRQADSAGVTGDEELVRLTVHGVLHVLGHDHPAGEDRVEGGMWQVQETLVREIMGE
ncbi:MAG TPA: rRNA maturation RNase YbeY [Longimicrobiales bacterium]|nr:rRNA maturation RNase YbeY [Longimicrobiales bacterium]